MDHDPTPILFALDRLRQTLESPGGEVSAQLKTVLAMVEDIDPDTPGASRVHSELAYCLARVAATSGDNILVRDTFQALVDMGDQGVMLASSFLWSNVLAQQTLRMQFKKLDTAQRLALLNRFFSMPRGVDSPELDWAFETVHEIQGDDPEGALLFLDGLAGDGLGTEKPVSYAVQRELLKGRFGFWVQELMNIELNPEQSRYMARTVSRLESSVLAGKLGKMLRGAEPADLPVLLGTLARATDANRVRAVKVAMLFLKHKSPAVMIAAVRALATMRSAQLVPAMIFLYAKQPALRSGLHALCLTLPSADFLAFIKKLPASLRGGVLGALVRALARLEPGLVREVCDAPASKGPVGALKKFVSTQKPVAPRPEYAPPLPKAPAKGKENGPSLMGKVKSLFGSSEDGPQGNPVLEGMKAGDKLSSRDIKGGMISGGAFKKMQFSTVIFSSVSLTECGFDAAVFVKCRFKNVDFRQSRFKSARFNDCEFTDCRFEGSLFEDVRMAACAFVRTHLAASTAKALRLAGCSFKECGLWGMWFEKSYAIQTRFVLTDFSHASFLGSKLSGVEFEDCTFGGTFARDAQFLNATAQGCIGGNNVFFNVDSDDAFFLDMEELTRANLCGTLCTRQKPSKLPPALTKADGAKLMLGVVERFLFEQELAQRRKLMLAANRRRTLWCAAKLGPVAARVVDMLPGLVEADRVVGAKGVSAALPSTIVGYQANYSASQYLAEHFGDQKQAKTTKKKQPAIRIEAFYSIGSVGSIAQTGGSDIDMWVCYDHSAVSKEDRAALAQKFATIEAWADAEHDLELHFFVMDLKSVRENNFGFSDKESAGSSQALLLKEEFYRTAVLLAGKKLAWWLLPSGGTEKSYRKGLSRIEQAHSIPPDDVIDLGGLDAIPKEEFFGASLWQIVKALKSPFKSIMKFALLDSYIQGKGKDLLICNRIKSNIFEGKRDFWSVDPYAVLFGEVFGFYRNAGEVEATELMRMAFEQKTHFSSQTRTSGRMVDMQGFSYLEYFFPYCEPEVEGTNTSMTGEAPEPLTFSMLHDLGQQVSKFMFGTYESIQGKSKDMGGKVFITDEDLTKLGRKIFGHFMPRDNKIMHTPFVESPKKLFASLDHVCEGSSGLAKTWAVFGEPVWARGKKDKMELIRRDKQPVRLLAWMVANHVFEKGIHISGQNLQAPVSVPDLRTLLETLESYFPPKTTFDAEVEETLRQEVITKVFISINFMAPREVKQFKDVVLIYATNWGEMFCITKPVNPELMETTVSKFVAANTDTPPAADMDILVHRPQKSLAPKVNEI